MIRTQHIRTHLGLNRILMLALGLWPYQQSRFVPFQFSLLLGILTTFILSQLAVLVTSICTLDLVLKILFSVFLLSIGVINYIAFYVNSKKVKFLIEQMQHNYDQLKDKNEIAIMDSYGSKTKYYTIIFTASAVCTFPALLLSQIWPHIFDMILLANKTRPIHTLQFINEYFLDRERYLYFSFLHANVALFICGIMIICTGTMLIAYGQHICGMFRIASYRMQHAIKLNLMRPRSLQKKNSAYKGIICAVDIHRKSLQFAEFFLSTFTLCLCFVISTGVISTSLNLLRILLTLSSKYDMEELVVQFIILTGQFLYMYLGNYLCQEITDHNAFVFVTVYSIRWYVAPLQIQKMILFMLQQSTKSFTIQIGGVFVGSLEGFATLINASVSYCTVIYSTRR